jgi:hypothetical protein
MGATVADWLRDALWLIACVAWYWSGRLTGRRETELEYAERARWFTEQFLPNESRRRADGSTDA